MTSSAFATPASLAQQLHYPSRRPKAPHPWRCALGRRALGVDYGLARTGLAVSVGIAPRPLLRIDARDATTAASLVAAAARENLADEIVLGLPLNAAGERGEQAEKTLLFARKLAQAAPRLPLLLLDERFTSQEADAVLAHLDPETRRALRDSAAAASLLERYFAEGDDVRPTRFYDPPPVEVGSRSVREGRASYGEWKAAAVKAAAEQAAAMPSVKGRRRKRKGKKR